MKQEITITIEHKVVEDFDGVGNDVFTVSATREDPDYGTKKHIIYSGYATREEAEKIAKKAWMDYNSGINKFK